jgi:hypothetical protein
MPLFQPETVLVLSFQRQRSSIFNWTGSHSNFQPGVFRLKENDCPTEDFTVHLVDTRQPIRDSSARRQ